MIEIPRRNKATTVVNSWRPPHKTTKSTHFLQEAAAELYGVPASTRLVRGEALRELPNLNDRSERGPTFVDHLTAHMKRFTSLRPNAPLLRDVHEIAVRTNIKRILRNAT